MNILEMAVDSNCQKFLAQPVVQNYLTKIWYGNNKETSCLVSTLCVSFFFFFQSNKSFKILFPSSLQSAVLAVDFSGHFYHLKRNLVLMAIKNGFQNF